MPPMILDTLARGRRYFPPGSPFILGLEFIQKALAGGTLADGRYDLDGDNCYAMVQSYSTRPADDKFPESHRRYVDIQALLAGEEVVEWLPVAGLTVETPYAEEGDIVFYRNAPGPTPILLRPGLFAIFFPEDGHKPGCALSVPAAVRKVVVKIRDNG